MNETNTGTIIMGEILLDWKGHDKVLSTKLWEFFKEEYLVDFSVTCHGQQKKVHKFVMALLFPILKESLRSGGTFSLDEQEPATNGQSSKIPEPQCLSLDNVANHAEDIEYLIQFAYTGKTTVPKEHTDCLKHIANNMEIQCLKDSFNRRENKRSTNNDKTEPLKMTLSKLKPRIHLKKEKEDLVSSDDVDDDDDLDFHSTLDEKSNLDIVESSSNERTGSSRKKIIIIRKRIPRKRQREDEKPKIKSVRRRNVSKTVEQTLTDSKDEANCEVPPNKITATSTNTTGKKVLKCPQCDYIAQYPNRLLRHLGSHVRQQAKDRKKFLRLNPEDKEKQEETVVKDDEAPSNEQSVTVTKDDENKRLKCPQCDYVAQYPNKLVRHLGTHVRKQATSSKPANTCKTCNSSFETRQLFEAHRESKCGTEPLVCKYCGHQTTRKKVLVQHMIVMHQVDANGNPLEKNVKCLDCDFFCYARHQLRAHARAKHERVGKFKCQECDYTAPYIKDLRRHERGRHQNISDYMCEECGHRYKSSGKLSRHVLIQHKGVKPHKCNICNAEYSNTLSYNIHMQGHEGKVEYKFVCHVCGHNLRRKYELRTHLRKKHGMDMEEELAATNDIV